MILENLPLFVVFLVFACAGTVQLFYYLWYYSAVNRHRDPSDRAERNPVSVIICARNEAENLQNFLPSVLEQDYPDFEVIVVNDCSEDNTADVLGAFLLKYPNLKVSSVNKDPKFTHNKKFAQFIGIKAAKNDILLFTDSDCQPESLKWIEMMTSHFTGKKDFVLGYGGYLKRKGLLNRYIRYDTMMIALQYLGMALRGRPYMGVGRNLAYRRSLFFEKKGFATHYHVISGDDDLFVNSNAVRVNTSVEFRREAHTRSVPEETFGKWVNQKKRHFTAAPYYKASDRFLLFLEPFTRILFYASFVLLLSWLFLWEYVLIVFGLRLIIQIVVLARGQKTLCESGLIIFSLFFDIFSPVLNAIVYLDNKRSRSVNNVWK